MELTEVNDVLLGQQKKYELQRIGGALKSLRKKHGITQVELAEMSSVQEYIVSLIENRKTQPSLSTIQKFCVVFNMDLREFFIYAASKSEV